MSNTANVLIEDGEYLPATTGEVHEKGDNKTVKFNDGPNFCTMGE